MSAPAVPRPKAGQRWLALVLPVGTALALAWGGWHIAKTPHPAQQPGAAALFGVESERPQLIGPHGRVVPLADSGVPLPAAPHRRTPASAAKAAATLPQAHGLHDTPALAPVLDEAAAAAMAVQACKPLLPRLPTVNAAQCASTRLVDSGARSFNGLPLYWRDVLPVVPAAPAGTDAPRPAAEPLHVLVVGAIHGDEPTSASLALRWIGMAESNALPTRRPVHWRFIPVLNPDGMLARKATRVNARGVDLNRNFPTPGWERDAPVYWEKRTRKDPRRWPGPEPLSEPESRFLHEQMAQFEPDLVVSIHAPYGVLDYDGPQPPPSRLGRLRLDQLGVFPGSLGHYGSVHLGLPVVTIELQHELKMPQDDEVRMMWRDLLRWMDRHLADAAAPAGRP